MFYPNVNRPCYSCPCPASRLLSFQRPLTYIYQCPTSQLPPTPPNLLPQSQPLYPWPALAAAFVCLICSLCIIDLALSSPGERMLPHSSTDEHTGGAAAVFYQCLWKRGWMYLTEGFFFSRNVLKLILGGNPVSSSSDSTLAWSGPDTHQANKRS